MDEQEILGEQVRQWALQGRWIDCGRWKRVRNGTLECYPIKREIAAKCKLLRTIPGWQGAGKRIPREGEFGIPTTAGL